MAEPLAVLIAARDEEARIGQTVEALRAAFPEAEIVVADDGSRDSTAAAARRAGARVVRLPRLGKGQALTLAEREAPPGALLLCDADLEGDLAPLLDGADLSIAAFAERQGGGFGIAKRAARALVRTLSGFEAREPLSGQRALSRAAREACFPLAPGFGCEVRMTIDAVRAGLRVEERELPLRHRATGRDTGGFVHRGRQLLDAVLACGPTAINHRGLRLPLVGALVALGGGKAPARVRAGVAAIALLGLADDLWSGPERGFRAHLARGSTTGVAKAVGIPLVALATTRSLRKATARRARRERAEPARHASGPRAEGIPGRRRARPRTGEELRADRRPARSLRSPRDDDARRRRGERSGGLARLWIRGQAHGQGSTLCDCSARRPRPPWARPVRSAS